MFLRGRPLCSCEHGPASTGRSDLAEVRHLGDARSVSAAGCGGWGCRRVVAARAVGLVQLLRGALADAGLADQFVKILLAGRHLGGPLCCPIETKLFYHNYVCL